MRVIRFPDQTGPRVIALGTFDGLHLGHRELIREARECAVRRGIPLRVCTFDRHPLSVVRPDAAPRMISTLPEKLALLAALEVDEVRVYSFSPRMAAMEAGVFLDELRSGTRPEAVFAGWNYTFGKGGQGNAALLQADAELWQYEAHILSPVRNQDGKIISSSAIRELISSGRMSLAEEMLGHPYTLTGVICNEPLTDKAGGNSPLKVAVRRGKIIPAPGQYVCRVFDRRTSFTAELRVIHADDGAVLLACPDPHSFCLRTGQRVRMTLYDPVNGSDG